MRSRSILLFLVLAVTAVFAAVNWSAFVAPTPLFVGWRTVEAPLGLILLGLMALLTLAFVIYVVSAQAGLLMEARRQSKELQVQRELADRAEASRFTELRNFMSAELLRVTQSSDEMRDRLLARLEAFERQNQAALEQSALSVSASIGELEDRLEHRVPFDGRPPARPHL